MRKIVLTTLASALLAAATVQIAAAAEHHKGRIANRVTAPATERFRNSNAYALPSAPVEYGWPRENEAESAPAGR